MYMDAFSKDMLDMGGCLSAAKATAATAAAQQDDQQDDPQAAAAAKAVVVPTTHTSFTSLHLRNTLSRASVSFYGLPLSR